MVLRKCHRNVQTVTDGIKNIPNRYKKKVTVSTESFLYTYQQVFKIFFCILNNRFSKKFFYTEQQVFKKVFYILINIIIFFFVSTAIVSVVFLVSNEMQHPSFYESVAFFDENVLQLDQVLLFA
jgi:hypothetical protein